MSFFYELQSQKWGFDLGDKGCARVFYFSQEADLVNTDCPKDLEQDACLPTFSLSFESVASLPTYSNFCELPQAKGASDLLLHQTQSPWDVYDALKAAGIRAKIDLSDNSLGWKCAQYEMKGVPLRIEIGPKDIEQNQCVIVTRHNREKSFVSLDGIADTVKTKLTEVHDGLYKAALENRERRTYSCVTMDEITEALENNGDGFIKAMWCGDEACEDKVKEVTGVGSRCIPFEQENLSDKCVCCGKPAKCMVYWGKAY